ncbi:hypothetical protein Tco_0202064 [Tanacetum coccineum]
MDLIFSTFNASTLELTYIEYSVPEHGASSSRRPQLYPEERIESQINEWLDEDTWIGAEEEISSDEVIKKDSMDKLSFEDNMFLACLVVHVDIQVSKCKKHSKVMLLTYGSPTWNKGEKRSKGSTFIWENESKALMLNDREKQAIMKGEDNVQASPNYKAKIKTRTSSKAVFIFATSFHTLEVVLLSDTTQIGSYQLMLSLRALIEKASDLGFQKEKKQLFTRYCSLVKKIIVLRAIVHGIGRQQAGREDALSKLLEMGTMAEYQNEFEMLINRVTGISESLLKTIYISELKLVLQKKLLRARPTTLGEAFSLARIIEARFEAIAKKEKEHIIKKKADTILSLQSELASPEIKGSLDADEDIVRSKFDEFLENKKSVKEVVVGGGEALGVDKDESNRVISVIKDGGGEFDDSLDEINFGLSEEFVIRVLEGRDVSGESLVVFLIPTGYKSYVVYGVNKSSFANNNVAMRKEAKIQRRI